MDWTDIIGLAAIVIGALAVLFAGLFWLIRAVVRNELATYTRPIQPGYRNGGESLADIAHKLDRLLEGGSHG